MRRHVAVNQSSLRDQNLRVVGRALWSAGGGLSRADLASATGLTRATVSRLVAQLIAADLVIEGGPTDSGQPGRPGTPLYPAPATVAAVGMDVNVDHYSARVIDLTGQILAEFVVPRDPQQDDPELILGDLGRRAAELVTGVRDQYPQIQICSVSLAIPGLITDSHEIRLAPNLGWRSILPADLLGAEFTELGVRLVVENDANLQAIAASRIGPGRLVAEPTFLYVGGDIGVGGALLEGGEFRRGGHGWAGELGHMTVYTNGLDCACGSKGCLERYAGRRAVHEAAGVELDFGSAALVERLQAGDAKALQAIERAADALGIAIGNALNLLDVRQVILGTSLAEIAEWLLPQVQVAIDSHLMWPDFETVEVRAAPPDLLPSSTGGAYHLLERVLDDPAGWIAAHSSDAFERC